jgi:hypothetical protein
MPSCPSIIKDGMVVLNQVPHPANHRDLVLLHIDLHQRDAMRIGRRPAQSTGSSDRHLC